MTDALTKEDIADLAARIDGLNNAMRHQNVAVAEVANMSSTIQDRLSTLSNDQTRIWSHVTEIETNVEIRVHDLESRIDGELRLTREAVDGVSQSLRDHQKHQDEFIRAVSWKMTTVLATLLLGVLAFVGAAAFNQIFTSGS